VNEGDRKQIMNANASSEDERRARAVVNRVLARAGTALDEDDGNYAHDGEQLDREERSALRRVGGLSTEREDVADVEYRQLRLERVILVGLWGQNSYQEAEISLRELAALADTAGSEVLDGVLQRRALPDAATYLGSGKARELRDLVAAHAVDTIIVDEELTASQRRGLEDIVDAKVIDRTTLILDIFAQHASSREGKAQVELAQLEYLLPRLRGWGESMSRQAGGRVAAGAGIGSRGPGETKIELDRRRIRTRAAKLRREIAAMGPARETKRAARRRSRIPSVAIMGYTNAGKSSILNRLTGAGVLVENALFATLDPTVRRSQTADGRVFTLTDTVGFVRRLPHQLVEAFRSSLEEVRDADVLLHVVDASHPDPKGQISAVRSVVSDMRREDATEIIVLNKADIADMESVAQVRAAEPDAILVSAATGAGFTELLDRIADALPRPEIDVDCVVPYDRGDLIHRAHEAGEVTSEEHLPAGTRLIARVDAQLADEIERVVVGNSKA